MMPDRPLNLTFIGFGEAAQAFISRMARSSLARVRAFDVKVHADDQAALRDACTSYDVECCADLASAVADADLVWSVVTADQAYAAAEAVAAHIAPNALFLDCNSCAPHTKQASAKAIGAAGARYVDVAVMSPVLPARNKTPMLLSGEHSAAAHNLLTQLDMNATVEPGPVGTASAIKMVRSIMVKGMEALFAECTLAGRLAGVDQQVFASLEASNPGFQWAQRSGYNLERMTLHGERRAAEMEEVCAFLDHLGMPEKLSETTVRWQRRVAATGVKAREDDYATAADELITAFALTAHKATDK